MQINQANNSLKSILPPVILTDCTLWYCIRTVFCSRQKNLLWQLSSNTQLLLLLEKYAHVVVGLHTAAKSAKLFNPELDILIMFSWFSLGSVFWNSRSFFTSCEQGNKPREQNWIKIQIYSLRVMYYYAAVAAIALNVMFAQRLFGVFSNS